MIVLQMSRQVLGVTFPLSKQRQSAALLNQCIAVSSSTYFPGKTSPNVPGIQADNCLHTPLVDTLLKCLRLNREHAREILSPEIQSFLSSPSNFSVELMKS